MNKYYKILGKILDSGKVQANKKGNIKYLLNEQLHLTPMCARKGCIVNISLARD